MGLDPTGHDLTEAAMHLTGGAMVDWWDEIGSKQLRVPAKRAEVVGLIERMLRAPLPAGSPAP
jgi:hypothetical protein